MSSCSGEVRISDYLTVLMNRFKFHLTGGCERSAEVRSNTFLDKNVLEYLFGNALLRCEQRNTEAPVYHLKY